MSETQKNPIGSQLKANVVQQNLQDLYQFAHTHYIKTTAPLDNEGAVNDIVPVLVNGSPYLYVKFPSIGWKKVLLT